ncbi:hypothetical protein B0H34DRAFT_820332 [Crassisporium funariophilum]|nr:hypothetical protein B0H34DRAFT_820332 [Crassisporium funariophilum]
MTHLPPFIATSLPQFNLPPTPSLCLLPHTSLLTSPVFNPPAYEIKRILAALAAVPDRGKVAVINESLVVKSRLRTSIQEAMAMMYIQQQTSIPVPKVHLCFQHNKKTHIVMERMKGQPLADCLPSMTEQQLRNVGTQLAGFI